MCYYLSILGLRLNHGNKRRPRTVSITWSDPRIGRICLRTLVLILDHALSTLDSLQCLHSQGMVRVITVISSAINVPMWWILRRYMLLDKSWIDIVQKREKDTKVTYVKQYIYIYIYFLFFPYCWQVSFQLVWEIWLFSTVACLYTDGTLVKIYRVRVFPVYKGHYTTANTVSVSPLGIGLW